jgi:hypothetical protein
MKSSQFPRGLPFKPPLGAVANEATSAPAAHQPVASTAVAPEAAFRAWAARLAIVTVSAVAVIVLIGVLAIVWLIRPAAPQPESIGRNSAAELVRASGPALSPAPRLLEPAEMKSGPARDEPGPTQNDLGQINRANPLLKTVGSLTAASLYQTYLTLGLLADSSEKEVYSPAEARKVLTTLTSLLDSLDTQLAAVAKSEVGQEDSEKLLRSRQLVTTLRIQAKELRAYWDTPEEDLTAQAEHERQFHMARDKAWGELKELLAFAE